MVSCEGACVQFAYHEIASCDHPSTARLPSALLVRAWVSVETSINHWSGGLAMQAIQRNTCLALIALAVGMFVAQGAMAHHGWGWASEEEFELTGKITNVKLGNPHGEVTLDAQGEKWVVEVGQPWRNERAGLTPELLSVGRLITAHGHRSAKESEKLMKAERVIIDGKSYDLYPDRKS
jgi:hypothetical protein